MLAYMWYVDDGKNLQLQLGAAPMTSLGIISESKEENIFALELEHMLQIHGEMEF